MSNIAIIPIGGIGVRMNNDIPKQFIKVNNKSIYMYTLEKFDKHKEIDKIILAFPKNYPEYQELVEKECKENNIKKVVGIIEGGKTQLESIFNCINSIKEQLTDDDKIIVHVGNRPNLSVELIDKCIKESDKIGSLSTIVPEIEVLVNKKTKEIIPRNDIIRIQTPQVYFYKDLKDIVDDFNKYINNGNTLCDLFLNMNKKISFIEGELLNFKITYPEDLELFKKII